MLQPRPIGQLRVLKALRLRERRISTEQKKELLDIRLYRCLPFDLVSHPLFEHEVGLVEIVSKGVPWNRVLARQLHSLTRLHSDLPVLLLLLLHGRGSVLAVFILAVGLKRQDSSLSASLTYTFMNGAVVVLDSGA